MQRINGPVQAVLQQTPSTLLSEAANATINRELAALTRAYLLGIEAGRVTHKPTIRSLKENNTRKGFFEREQFEAVRAKLPAPRRRLVTFLYLTGWRVNSEAVPLQWRQVDFEGGTVRLDPGTTKNGEARVFPMTAELRALLEAQRAYTDAVQREKGIICPHVFHRDGEPIKTFRRAWKSACKRAVPIVCAMISAARRSAISSAPASPNGSPCR